MEEQLAIGLKRMLSSVGHRPHPFLLVSGSEWTERLEVLPSPSVWGCDRHQNYELAYVDQGSCTMTIQGRAYELAEGDFCIVGPGEEHYEAPTLPERDYVIYWLQSIGTKVLYHVTRYSGNARTLQFLVPIMETWLGTELDAILANVVSEVKTKGAFTDWIVRGQLLSALAMASRRLQQAAKRDPFTEASAKGPVVHNVIKFIESNYANPELRVRHIAESVGLSPNYLSVLVSQDLGQSPYKFLMHVRMRHARELLVADDAPIAKVASEVGFTCPHHFSSIFKRLHGVSPTTFRVEAREFVPVARLH